MLLTPSLMSPILFLKELKHFIIQSDLALMSPSTNQLFNREFFMLIAH